VKKEKEKKKKTRKMLIFLFFFFFYSSKGNEGKVKFTDEQSVTVRKVSTTF